ncbi:MULTISPECIES: lipoprotein [Spiroplasma]|uniref:Lipoprotein n=1 Tax=Spiroplasma eriocheiris TaxID=315358 RepID=A0A0H3XJJ8_9MOLU|nr:lipoprotein [Spiroplasma eriocheiris]AHF57569.1 hypothetical protein SPE_0440 [Spiroplasma eriocheiris CCTCC M 207170]AKM54026.1 hypothetical protein SERIO_v1c04470 [Spiroplasma eriocheiris]
MKKLLAILGAVGLTATGASSVVACNKPENPKPPVLGGLTASDFSQVLLNVDSKEKLNTTVVKVLATKVESAHQKEVNDNLDLFGNAFLITYKGWDGTSSLKNGDTIHLTITKANDDQIREFYKDQHGDFISPEQLALARKMQGYLAGTKFDGDVLISDQNFRKNISNLTFPQPITVTGSSVATPGQVSKADVTSAVNMVVQNLIDKIVTGTKLDTDYHTAITLDDGTTFPATVDLSTANLNIKITVTSISTSTLITGNANNKSAQLAQITTNV